MYAFGIGVYLSSRKNFRRGEEHGSAKWGVPALLNRKYADKNYFSNNDMPDNLEKLSLYSGVYPKNITRLMENQEFSSEIKTFKAMDSTNLSVEL